MLEMFTTGVAILLLTVPALLFASPEEKAWAAELIERFARFACTELIARAYAQRAARIAWAHCYQEERTARNESAAGSRTNHNSERHELPAAPASSTGATAAAIPESAWNGLRKTGMELR